MLFLGETCVHVAAKEGEKEILQHLTCYGADINAQVRPLYFIENKIYKKKMKKKLNFLYFPYV